MDENTKKIISEHYEKLPSYVRESLEQIHWDEEILAIGKKHGLHIDEMGTLQLETMMVLVGIVHPDEYPKSLQQELHIPKEKIDAIVADVNEKVFKNIREALISYITTQDGSRVGEWGGGQTEEELEEKIFKKTGIEIDNSGARNSPAIEAEETSVGIAERSILEHSGVEIEPTINEDKIVNDSANIPDRKEILNELENPQKGGGVMFSNLIKSKLDETVITTPEKTKYEDKKPAVAHDPYREPIK